MGHGQDGPSLRAQSRGKNESPMTGVPSPHRNLLAPFSGSRCPREKVQIPHWLQRPCGSRLTFFNLTYPQLTRPTPHTSFSYAHTPCLQAFAYVVPSAWASHAHTHIYKANS